MERYDFSSTMTIIKRYISDAHGLSQTDILYQLFLSFLGDDDSVDFDFDIGLVCKWMNGQARLSPRISAYYHDPRKKKLLARDIENNILPLMYDIGMATQELHELASLDISVSEREKTELFRSYPPETSAGDAKFIADILCFAMERGFVKRDAKTQKLLSAGGLSPRLQDYIIDDGIQKPCRTFCGREQELDTLHAQLTEHQKIFLQGIAGIGKSELAKAYAWEHRKDYTNILHLTYSGDLKQMIMDMEFIGDQQSETDAERFRNHNRFLRTLKEDTLLIIDNFNTTATKDELLSVVLKYNCRILFTTRSRFEQGATMEVTEIADKQALLNLVANFYSRADHQPELVEQIIETVHSHTLAVELAARLLENGILEPSALLAKLQAEHAALNTDSIGIQKDGKSQKATYYGHIHTLFSLYALSDTHQDIMRSLTLVPLTGIRARVFGLWLRLKNLDAINELVEMGFIQMHSGIIALHPMVQEIGVTDMTPSVQRCGQLVDELHIISCMHGLDIPYYKVMFQTIENIIAIAKKDDDEVYLQFLEDVFQYMEKYQYQQGMRTVLHELEKLLKNQAVGQNRDRALLLDCHAVYAEKFDGNTKAAIKLEEKAIGLVGEVTKENAALAANLHANLGGMYHGAKTMNLALEHTETAIQILRQYHLEDTHNSIAISCNYANMLTTIGQPERGLTALRKCAKLVAETMSDHCMDYAMIQESIGVHYLQILDLPHAHEYFDKARSLYETVFAAEPEILEEHKKKLLSYYSQTGTNIGKLLMGK